MSVFIDTSGLLAVLDRDDENHAAAAEAWQHILTSGETLVITNYILIETCALVQNRLGMAAVNVLQEDIVPVLRIEWIDSTVHHASMGIILSAMRKKLSLVDCVSFETMRLGEITTAFTFDRHFKEQGFVCLP